MKVHQSGLEKAKAEAVAARGEGGPAAPAGLPARSAQREASGWEAWGGQPITSLVKPHVSKMEREVARWKQAAARKEAAGPRK